MGSFCNYLEDELLDQAFGAAAWTAPVTLYVGLSTSDPGETGALTGEPVIGDNSYARVAVTNNKTNFSVSSGGSVSNATAFTFPTASAAGWGLCSHFFISDASTAGNILCSGALTAGKTIDAGDTASFAIGALVITLN